MIKNFQVISRQRSLLPAPRNKLSVCGVRVRRQPDPCPLANVHDCASAVQYKLGEQRANHKNVFLSLNSKSLRKWKILKLFHRNPWFLKLFCHSLFLWHFYLHLVFVFFSLFFQIWFALLVSQLILLWNSCTSPCWIKTGTAGIWLWGMLRLKVCQQSGGETVRRSPYGPHVTQPDKRGRVDNRCIWPTNGKTAPSLS